MSGLDPIRLCKTLTYLLRHGARGAGLVPDGEGWFSVDQVARVTSGVIRKTVRPEDVREIARRFGGGRFDVEERRIRPSSGEAPHRHELGGPDILYHAAPAGSLEEFRARGALVGHAGAQVHLSRTEAHAWRVAHRQWEEPVVLFVDASRARRDGERFERTRVGQYYVPRLPLRYVLNLRDRFAEQTSAGGFVVDWTGGVPRIALIRVARRTNVTWEVAKGKLEPGETPDDAAVREVREEMGVLSPLKVSRSLGTVRYGFSTPEGDPRLKTIYLYLLEVEGDVGEFRPARGEGIDAVRWFSVDEALNVLAHPSLRSAIGRLLGALEDRARELGVPLPPASLEAAG